MSTVQIKAVSSLEKIFKNTDFSAMEFGGFSMLKNERSSFQVAYRADSEVNAELEISSPLAEHISAFQIGFVPAGTVAPKNSDDYFITKESGEFPEVLFPVKDGRVTLPANESGALWFEIKAENELPAGEFDVTVTLKENGEELAFASTKITVIDARLPKQSLIFTNWFHTDCLAEHYGVPVFSDEYWRIVENYLKRAREFGMNMVITPVFTPPLDTKVGGERPTVQLVDVEVTGRNEYKFGFKNFDKWIEMCSRCGIDYFEMSHFFTQWGAKHAPKIVAKTKKGEEKIFGWKTRASGKKYKKFLQQFAAAFITHIDELGISKDKIVLHVSDEPNKVQLRAYKKASKIVHDCFPGFNFVDALSDFDFYEKKVVDTPIPSNDHIKPFIGNVPELWTYYCCVQANNYVSNRFFGMPSQRNRVLGYQLYATNAVGFLHWGFNFWFKQFSIGKLDPFKVTDAGGGFSSGDSFVVYPAKDGTPLNSLRLHVFYDGFQDMMALQLLESKIGREKAMAILEDGLDEKIDYNTYPRSAKWQLETRERINKAIADSK